MACFSERSYLTLSHSKYLSQKLKMQSYGAFYNLISAKKIVWLTEREIKLERNYVLRVEKGTPLIREKKYTSEIVVNTAEMRS